MHRILDWLSGRPYLLLTLTMLMWGGNAVAGRLAVGEVSPMALTGLRWVVPVAVLGVALRYQLLTHRQALLERWPSILLMGTLGLTVFNALFYLAAHHTTAVNRHRQLDGLWSRQGTRRSVTRRLMPERPSR